MLKLDRDGNTEWQETYGGTEDDVAQAIQQTSDGGYIVAGYTASFGAGKKDVWVLKLDKDGVVVWQKTYGGTEDDWASSILETKDGGFIVAATTSSFGAGKSDIWILKLDKDGSAEWQKTYGLPANEEATSIRQTSDDAYIVTGVTDSFTTLYKGESWVLKLDSVGNIQTNWQILYGGSANDKIYSIEPTRDGKYVVVGNTDSSGVGKKDVWVMMLSGNGTILWKETWGGSEDDEGFSVQETLDGGVVVAGWTGSLGAGKGDLLLLKLDSKGAIPDCQYLGTSSAALRGLTTVSGVGSSATVKDTSATVSPGSGSESLTSAEANSLCMVQKPEIVVDPTVVEFGSVVMGSSTSETIGVKNLGSKDLVIETINIAGTNHLDFSIRQDTCSGQTLTSLASCNVEVGFSPTGNGKRLAGLLIPWNDSDETDFVVTLEGEGVPPISPAQPPDHAFFTSCSLYNLPTFTWDVVGSFKSYELQFSNAQDFNANAKSVKVKTTSPQVLVKSTAWKQVMLLPAGPGGPVYWRVFGTYTGGRSAFVSFNRTFTVESALAVKNARIDPVSAASLPTLTWENNCNVNFKVWFGNDAQFSKKYTVSFKIKNPMDGNGTFSKTLTSRQWDSIKKLVGGQIGATIYWKVESWDGANRESQTSGMNFVLEE